MDAKDMDIGLREADQAKEAAAALKVLEGQMRTLTKTSSRLTVSMNGAFTTLHRNLNRLEATLTPVASVGVRMLNEVVKLVQPAAQGLSNVLYTLFGARWAGVTNGLEGTAEAADSAASSTKKLSAAQRTLLGFDEIERLGSTSSASSSGGSSGSSSQNTTATVTLETVAWAEQLKTVLGQVWEPFERAWKRKGKTVLESAQKMLDSLGGAVQQVGKDWLKVWQDGTGQEIAEHLLQTVSQLSGSVAGLADGFREAWVHAGNGNAIVTALLGMVNDLAAGLDEMSAATQQWAEGLNLNPLVSGFAGLLSALEPLVELITRGLAWGYENILLPLAGWTVEEAAPAALSVLTGGLELLTGVLELLAPVATVVWEDFLAPVASWTGGAAADLVTQLGDALGWCGEQLQSLASILSDESSFEDKMNEVGGWLVEGLKSGVTGALTGIGTWLYDWFVQPIVDGVKDLFGIASPSTVFQEIGGFLVDGLCDGISEGLSQAWDAITPDWEELKSYFTDLTVRVFVKIGTIWDSLKDTWSELIGHFADILVNISAAISTTWSSLKDAWSELMGHFVDKVVLITVSLLNSAESLWNTFKQGWEGKSLKLKITWTTTGLTPLQQAISDLLFGGRGWPKLAFAARGGVFSSPTLTMLGEAGREAVVPLENNTGWMDGLARRIASQLSGSAGGGGSPQTITVQCVLDGRVVAENTIRYVNRETRRTGVHPMLAGI